MKTLWNRGIEVYDAYAKDNFLLRAMIFCTISDFPAYGIVETYINGKKRELLKSFIEAHTELINSSEVEDGVDPLIMVVGPEHGGRTRGVGHLVGFKQGIEGYVAKKRRYCEREKITEIVNKKIKEAREEMDAEYEEKLARAINEMKSSQQQNENPESPLMRKSSCDSASNFDVLDNIQEASKCQLFLPYGTTKVLCAMGMVYPAKQVHGKSVLQGHAKVHVDKVEANYKDYILPVQTEEFNTLGETLFSFIQWPKKYMELTKAFNSNQTGNKKIVAANTSTQTATKQIVATNKESSTQKQTSPNLSRQEGPSNYIAAAPPTKRARPLNSLPICVTLDRGSLFLDQTLPYLDLGTCKPRGVSSFTLERLIELNLDAGFFILV
ncbi:ulp1 protease family, C-terminal catalytic domain-containing protein [Tanacetum coccineum]